jgi:hypothetical protein
MSSNHTPSKAGRKRSQDQLQTPSTPNSTATASASPFSPSKQRKPTPSELHVLYYKAAAVVIMAVNAYN